MSDNPGKVKATLTVTVSVFVDPSDPQGTLEDINEALAYADSVDLGGFSFKVHRAALEAA